MPILNKPERFFEIDFFRGIALLMMIFFHFLWDLNYFNFLQISLYTGFLGLFQKLTAGLFLFLVGISLTFSYNKRKENHEFENYTLHFLKRSAKIFFYALLITAFTFLFFQKEFIFFGILHLIAVSIILSVPFIDKKKFNLFFAAIILLFYVILFNTYFSFPFLVFIWHNFSISALDYFPIIPWFAFILLGIAFGNHFYPNGKAKIEFKEINGLNPIAFLGKHSLFIYFIHQPILISMLLAFLFLF